VIEAAVPFAGMAVFLLFCFGALARKAKSLKGGEKKQDLTTKVQKCGVLQAFIFIFSL
jgi:hypothetical protein